MADATVLNTVGLSPCGFESRLRHMGICRGVSQGSSGHQPQSGPAAVQLSSGLFAGVHFLVPSILPVATGHEDTALARRNRLSETLVLKSIGQAPLRRPTLSQCTARAIVVIAS